MLALSMLLVTFCEVPWPAALSDPITTWAACTEEDSLR